MDFLRSCTIDAAKNLISKNRYPKLTICTLGTVFYYFKNILLIVAFCNSGIV